MKIIAVGDNVADTYIKQKIFFPGGNCVNVAVDAKKAGADVSAYLGMFGDDDRAQHIKESLTEENVELINCRKVYAPTAQPRVILTDEGDRTFAPGPKNSVMHLLSLRLTPTDFAEIKKFDVVHVGIDSGIENYLDELHHITKVSFDFSDSRNESYFKRVLPFVDYAFFSGSEMSDEQVEEFAKKYLTLGPEVIVITRGANSAFLLTSQKSYYQKPQKVKVVDTMGAGDSFIAGFLVSYLNKNNLQEAALAASKNAAATCQLSGGFGHQKSF
ncbi:carbohydrate kinase [Lactobacillus kimbladii]|uniref:PfkB family carbohydrate kinase n=1 Tax=Lactobacillus TaxID=1578 RepID=UPI000EFB3915|nr:MULTISPECIES: PfkB family carbohydrate kinase [Lactobacillus]MBC6342332.1 carbohydrate kinase [Lactobacillus kimbladii]RMC55500.1 carbohydrate kinase [Lactobacillus sp. ESL0261]